MVLKRLYDFYSWRCSKVKIRKNHFHQVILKVSQNGKNSKIHLFECLTEISGRIGDPHTPNFFDQHLNFRMKVDLCFYHVCIKSYDPKQSGFQFSAKFLVHTLLSSPQVPSLKVGESRSKKSISNGIQRK